VNEAMNEAKKWRWLVGIDGGHEKHQVCLLDAHGRRSGELRVPHSGPGLMELCQWIEARTGGDVAQVAVAIEVPHGPVVETLLERGFAVYAINPKQLDRFRDRYSVAGAKDDRQDAFVLADALRTDPGRFRRLTPVTAEVVELRTWSRLREDLQQERNRFGNRLRAELWRYYPQALEVSDDVAAPWCLELLALAPTPEAAGRLRRPQVAALLARHRIRRIDAATVLRTLQAPAVRVAEGTVAGAAGAVGVLSAQLRVVNEELARCHRQLDRLAAALAAADEEAPGQRGEQRDAAILESLPGVGRIVLTTLLAEASDPLRAGDYHGLRLLSGAAPVTRQSGKRRLVLMRRACNPRLREAVFHWARTAVQCDPRLHAGYVALRARGHSHGRALRTTADRLLAIACAMLRTRTVYDPNRRTARAA
jgi:transposase